MFAKFDEMLAGVSRRRLIFIYDLVLILVLLVIGAICIQTDHFKEVKFFGFPLAIVKHYKLLFNCMWIGALGGLTISLKGVYDHGNPADPWKDAYNLWHYGRPISGAIAGLLAALLFIVIVPGEKISPAVLYGIAFIFGMQDRAFFDFLSTFAGRFLPKSDATPAILQITGIHPADGKGAANVKLTGQAIDKSAVVRIGGKKLGALVIAPDGTSASGTVALLGFAANTKVDVEVINPGGRSIVMLDGFNYLGD